MFPVTDSSSTIVETLLREAERYGVLLQTARAATRLQPSPGGWSVWTSESSDPEGFQRVLVATGGWKVPHLLDSLGLVPEPLAPSLFAFDLTPTCWLRHLPGVALEDAHLTLPASGHTTRGALLLTHRGLSGPAILRLSAWAARELQAAGYHFSLRIHFWPDAGEAGVRAWLAANRQQHPSKKLCNVPPPDWPHRLWSHLLQLPGAPPDETRWNTLSKAGVHWLVEHLLRHEVEVVGKSTHKEEFVTCGGVCRRLVDFRTMESREHRHLYFAGEVLDMDALTGGLNFQAAWATGWVAGHSLAGVPVP